MTREIIEVPLAQLTVSKLNVRRHGGKEIGSLAQSIRQKGLIYPLIVRKVAKNEYEVIAGKRRLLALQKLDKSGDCEGSAAPCIIVDDQTDAHALEISLIENTERLPMDVLDQYTAFANLAREGRSEAEIGQTFSVPVRVVKQRLALANLTPEAHNRYRQGDIDDKTLEALTLGSKERQRAYFKLLDDPNEQHPPLWQLKQWMLGGTTIDAKHAMFDLKAYKAPLATDLFNEETHCTDAEEFWRLQHAAVEALAEDFKAKGWQYVTTLVPERAFNLYQWEPATKANGGHVVLKLHASGQVQIEKGLIPQAEARNKRKDAQRQAQAAASTPATSKTAPATDSRSVNGTTGSTPEATAHEAAEPAMPELSAALRNYVDLVRHSAVCATLLKKPKVALRVLVASLIEGARNIQITTDRRSALSPQIAESVKGMTSEAAQESARASVLAALGLPADRSLFSSAGHVTGETQALLAKLMEMSDAQVLAILTLCVTESLAVGSKLVDCLGEQLAVDVTEHWQPDATLLHLIQRRAVIEPIAKEVLKDEARRALTGTVQHAKSVLAETFKKMGTGEKRSPWQPTWTKFPAGRYLGSE